MSPPITYHTDERLTVEEYIDFLKRSSLGRSAFPHIPLRFESFLCLWSSFTMCSSSEEIVMPNQPTYRSQVLDHLGLIAGMFATTAIGDVLDHATQQHPEMRDSR